MADEDVIDIKDDDLAGLLNNPDEYKNWIIEILKTDPSKLSLDVRYRLENNIINSETDMLLRSLANVIPYNMLIPVLRDQLGLSIQSDKDCVKSLKGFKKYLSGKKEQLMLDKIIEYVNSIEGELDEEIIPEMDLLGVVDKIPIEKFPEIYNCIDYINQITE